MSFFIDNAKVLLLIALVSSLSFVMMFKLSQGLR